MTAAAASHIRSAATSVVGQSRHFDRVLVTSDLPPNKRTVFGGSRHVSKVPQADSCAAANSASIQLVRRLVARYRALLHVSKDVLWTGAQHCFLGLGMMT